MSVSMAPAVFAAPMALSMSAMSRNLDMTYSLSRSVLPGVRDLVARACQISHRVYQPRPAQETRILSSQHEVNIYPPFPTPDIFARKH